LKRVNGLRRSYPQPVTPVRVEIILNRAGRRVVYWPMARLSKAMAVLMALLWLPMVSHCTWEHLSGLEILGCCTSAPAASHQESDCQTDLCASVESGYYKTEERAVTAPAPALQVALLTPALSRALECLTATIVVTPSVPAELRQRWHFVFRTAAPPRAPSFVS
jgi:hypothetical protein